MSTLRFICKRICCLMIIVISAVVITGCANLPAAEEETGQFIVNTRSGKIHSSSCQYVGQMNEENKKAVNSSLIDLLKQDYTICRKCRAGIGDPVGTEWVDSIVHPNLYIDDITIDASFNDYIKAVETMSEWYVDHIPTYAGGIQTEDFSKYRGELHNYKEYSLKNKGKIKTYKVLSSNSSEYNCNSLSKSDQILRANENAAKNYMDSYQSIRFKSKIAYYPCGELSMDSDYFTPGDDCVRYIFAICNKMDSQFTKKYRVLTRQTYSTTNSTDLTADRKDIAFGMNTLGFKIYDIESSAIKINNDEAPEGYIFAIEDGFRLKKGDILARKGHVHIYLGDEMYKEADNFGWGRVYRSFPQQYDFQVKKMKDGNNCVALFNGNGEAEYYTRIYRYMGK